MVDRETDNPWQPPAWLPLVLLPLAGVAMLWWNFDGWMHPIIDYGREVYVPWRITAGEVLYRDIAYFNGPLSPYLNAAWFRLFGVELHTLIWVNLAVLGLVCTLLYRIAVRIADRFAATAAGLLFVLLFSFQHIDDLGNFNWIAPYSHEMTHGLALTMAAVWCVARFIEQPRRRWLVAIGALLGAVFLTKPEVFAAAVLSCGVGILALGPTRSEPLAAALPRLLLVAGSAVVPPLLAWSLLSLAMPVGDALGGTVGAWAHVGNDGLAALQFYAEGRGTDDLPHSLQTILYWAAMFAGLGGLGLAAAWVWQASSGAARIAALAFPVALPAAILLAPLAIPWPQVFRPVLLFTLAAGFGQLLAFRRRRDPPTAIALMFVTLASALLVKIFLNVRFHHYGFGLAFPAAACCVLALTCWLPRAVTRRGWSGAVFRSAGLGIVAVVVAGCLLAAGAHFATKTARVGNEAEAFHARLDPYAEFLNLATRWLRTNTPDDATVVVLPEGVTINYFARRRNPTGHFNFMPPELIMYGEDRVLAALRDKPPDYFIVLTRETKEYGLPLFGTHYGSRIMGWVKQNYTQVKEWGVDPLHPDRMQDNLPGMRVLKRLR